MQMQLLSAGVSEVGMITGFASGKTRGLCADSLVHAVQYPGAKVILGRRTYKEMATVKEPFFVMAEKLFEAGWFVRPERWDFKEGTNYVRLVNGSQIHFSNFDDLTKFRNEEFSYVAVDQAEEIDESLWETLIGRIRWDRVPPEAWKAVAAANDDGHNWVWRRFVDSVAKLDASGRRCMVKPFCMFLEGHVDADGEPITVSGNLVPCSTRRFFHGTTFDNKENLKPVYFATLLKNPPAWQKRFIYATMEGGAGRILPDLEVVDHFDPPKHWPRWRGIDDALNSPACCVWLTANIDNIVYKGLAPNAIYIYREYHQGESSVDQHAKRILDLSRGEVFRDTIIDRHAFNLTQSRQGGGRVSIADLYAEEGLVCNPSTGDPWARVERIVGAHNRGMRVSKRCLNVIATVPEYRAESSPGDGTYKIKNRDHYHAIDALGYGLMAIPQVPMSDDAILGGVQRPVWEPTEDRMTQRHREKEWIRQQAAQLAAERSAQPDALGELMTSEFLGRESQDSPDIVPAFGWAWDS